MTDRQPSQPSSAGTDEAVAYARRRLAESPYPALRSVRCRRHNGVIVLSGGVPSFYFKQLAQEAVRSADGVGAIDNQLEVK